MVQTVASSTHDERLGRFRPLRDVVRVAVRCTPGHTAEGGHPCVVVCYPLRRTRGRIAPFPTLYWLTCPRLCAAVASLERDGMIAAMSDELTLDPGLRLALLGDHERYIEERWAILSPTDRELVVATGLVSHLRERGIGGMTNRAAVKCLHLHLAHHLASGNALGSLLVHRYGLQPCGHSMNRSNCSLSLV